MTEPKNKIDQLVIAVLTAVDERLELIRGQFAQLVDAADKHTAALAAWQQVIEHQQAELALRHAELDMKMADLALASKRAGRDAPVHAAAATAVAAAAPAPIEAAAPVAAPAPAPAPVAEVVRATPPQRPAVVLEPLAPLAPMPQMARTAPAQLAAAAPTAAIETPTEVGPSAEVAPAAAPTATVDVDFAELAKLVERQLEGWSGAA